MIHLALTFGLLLCAMTLLWGLSLALQDVSIVDIFWAPGFAGVAWVVASQTPGRDLRQWAVLALVSCWALRLGGHILLRKLGEPGEDHRYAAIRRKRGSGFWWSSLFQIFWLQAVLLWLVSWPLQGAFVSAARLGWLDGVGVALAAGGILLEGTADWQLTHFRAEPGSHDRVMDRGVWAWSRHPNYFGDFIMWWGFFLIGIAAGAPWWTVASPLVMSTLLVHFSGADLMEETIAERRPGYAAYLRRTNRFVPWPPQRDPRVAS